MQRALDELAVLGVATNQGFHRRLLADAAFQAGDIDMQFLERRTDLAAAAAFADGELLRLGDGRRAGRGRGAPARGGPWCAATTGASDAWPQRARHEGLQ